MPVRKVTVTEEFEAKVEEFRQQRGIKYWSVALLQLAATGYEEETGELPPRANVEPGGWRGSKASIEALMRYADKVTDGGRNDPIHYVEEEDEETDT